MPQTAARASGDRVRRCIEKTAENAFFFVTPIWSRKMRGAFHAHRQPKHDDDVRACDF
jgi:hypothetical protein